MKAILKNRHINLPKIRKRTEEAFNDSIIAEGYQLSEDSLKVPDSVEISKLDEWTNLIPRANKKKGTTSENLAFLYKNQGKFKTSRQSKLKDPNYSNVGIFLAKVSQELAKIKAVNYGSIYQNIQYCKGVYQNHFNLLLKTLQGHKSEVEVLVKTKEREIKEMRNKHIANISELVKSQAGIQTERIAQVRQSIESKEEQLEPLTKLLSQIEQTKVKVLKFALELGYDVRDEGLVWILRQLQQVPQDHEFPIFLNERQKNYIISKYKNNFILFEIEKEKENVKVQQKEILKQSYNNIQRDKQRRLSIIKQQQLLEKMKRQKILSKGTDHKYLNRDTMRLVEQNQNVKSTKYEIIYKQTVKKLNRLCIEETYGKNKHKKNHACEDKIVEDVKNSIFQSLKLKEKKQKIRTGQEKELFQILKVLRNQRYEQNNPNHRNPISVLCCLMGWKKAKKILQTQMNIPLSSTYQ